MNKQIMIVDNDSSYRKTAAIVLESKGYSVSLVESGKECLEKLRGGFRGLIFIDILIPEIDGLETILTIRNEGLCEGNTICLLTAVFDSGPQKEKLPGYIKDYVSKPYTAEDLLETVVEHVT